MPSLFHAVRRVGDKDTQIINLGTTHINSEIFIRRSNVENSICQFNTAPSKRDSGTEDNYRAGIFIADFWRRHSGVFKHAQSVLVPYDF
jgi:hypothetical protein